MCIRDRPYAVCERVCMPWVDMLCELRKSNIPLCSLESHTPLSRFDIIGFTLQYEMSYTNVLEMMDLGGVPVLSSERGEDDPIVLAGGPCAFNPEPLHLFIDAFLIGDGEDSIVEVTDVLNACKKMCIRDRLHAHRAGAGAGGLPLAGDFRKEGGGLAPAGDDQLLPRAGDADEIEPAFLRRVGGECFALQRQGSFGAVSYTHLSEKPRTEATAPL